MVPPIFLLVGPDFLARLWFEEKILAQKDQDPHELFVYDAVEFDLKRFLEEARTHPFIGKKFFWIRHGEEMKEEFREPLLRLFGDPPAWAVFFLLFESREKSGRDPLFKKIQGQAKLITVEEEDEGRQVLRRKLKRAGKVMEEEAYDFLEEAVGGDLGLADRLVDQLHLYLGSREKIGLEDVKKFIEEKHFFTPFDLVKSLAHRKAGEGLERLTYLRREGEGEPIMLLGLAAYELRRLWKLKGLLEMGKRPEEIQSLLGLTPYAARALLEESKSFTLQEIEEALEDLFQLDWGLKTGRLDGELGIERFLVRWGK